MTQHDQITVPTEEQPHDVTGDPVVVNGRVPAELFLPDRSGASPAIVLCPEAYGPNIGMRTTAAALAARGFVVLLPDYYLGDGPSDPEAYLDFTEVIGFLERLDFRTAFLDIATCVDHLRAHPAVDPSKVGLWGYCTGGTLALAAACLHREVAATVAFFPSQPRFPSHDDAHPVDPVDLLWAAQGPLLIQYGDQDGVMPAELLDEVERRLKAWDLDAKIVVHEGAGHAFNAPVAPLRHDAADRVGWAKAVEFVQTHLGA